MALLLPTKDVFVDRYDNGQPQVLWCALPADLDTPVSLMLKLTQAGAQRFLLESVVGASQRGRYSIIGWKPDLIWRCQDGVADVNRCAAFDAQAYQAVDKDALTSLREIIAESAIETPKSLPSSAAGLFGYLGYDMIRLVEKLAAPNTDALHVPDATLMRPSIVAVIDNAYDTVSFVVPVRPRKGLSALEAYAQAAERIMAAIGDMDRPVAAPPISADSSNQKQMLKSNISKKRYKEIIEIAKKYIHSGDIFQVVPSQRWKMPFKESPFSLYRALRQTNPSPYMFYFNFGSGQDAFHIVGASPEILVRVRRDADLGWKVTIRPIAGTRPRGATAEEDARFEKDLLADEKERAEHLMLLDLGRNDVGRVAEIGSVDPNEQFTVERYSHVMHIVSNVDGALRKDEDALSALLAGMPAGTVSGAPKIRAMQIIDELETEKRSVYAGAVGYFAANGEMDTCIALRTGVVKNSVLYAQAGGGIVADSDPEAEFQETVNKAKAVLRAAAAAKGFSRGNNRI
jgi:anthranilate synthase component 1